MIFEADAPSPQESDLESGNHSPGLECLITENCFTTDEEALALVEAMGWHGFVHDVAIATDEEVECHDLEQVVFVIEGTARTRFHCGCLLEVAAGSRVDFPAGLAHQDLVGNRCRIIVAFPVHRLELSQPSTYPD